MHTGPALKKVLLFIVCVSAILFTPSLLPAETHASMAIGKIASLRSVSVNGAAQPAGRAILAGELIAAQEAPAQISLKNGGSIVLTRGSAAIFEQAGNDIRMNVKNGVVAFRFAPGKSIQIDTPSHRFLVSKPNTLNVGEISVSRDAQTKAAMSSGALFAFEKATGTRYEVASAATPQTPQQIAGKGTLTRGRNTLTDDSRSFSQNLANLCVRVGGEQHKIVSNTANRLVLDGAWTLNNGIYDYEIGECTGAVAKAAPKSTPPPAVVKGGMSKGTKIAIGAIAGGAAGGIAAYAAGKGSSKSGS